MTLLATRLPRDTFDVHVCVLTRTGPYSEHLKRHQIPVTVIGKSFKADPLALVKLRLLVKRLKPNIIHTWLFAANSFGRVAALGSGVSKIVAAERCVDKWKVWYELAIDRLLARFTDRIVTNSNGVREFYGRHGLPNRKLTVIPNGVETASSEHLVPRDEILRRIGLPSDARLIGVVGRLWPQKRIKDVIWAADLLKVVRDDVHLLIIGDGPQRWRLQRFREQVEICDRVHFLGHRSDVAMFTPHWDCFWCASGYEGQSNAIMEAMAAGVPVVATDIPGNRDLVIPDITGFLIPLGSRAALARKTIEILDDSQLARRLGNGGRRRMVEQFGIEKMVQRYAAMYRELMEDDTRSGGFLPA